MSKNFTLKELISSETAKNNGIDNIPSFDEVFNLDEMCNELLQPLREAWGKPLIVTSGYRCKELNEKVHGSETSAHRIGYACDLQTSDMNDFDKFVSFASNWIKSKNFDQCIIETSGEKRWLHLGFKNLQGQQRKQIKSIG